MPEMTTSNANASQQLYNDDFLIELRQQMMKFAVLQLSSFHQAEDVVQEALVSALQYSGSFSGRSAFKTWVFAILKNKIVDLIRQKQRLVSMSELFIRKKMSEAWMSCLMLQGIGKNQKDQKHG